VLKTVVQLIIFVDSLKKSLEQRLFKIGIFCTNVKKVTFDQFNASLLNKIMNTYTLLNGILFI